MHAYTDLGISHAASTVFSMHLWYPPEVLVPLSVFDEEIPVAQNRDRDMVAAMKEREGSANAPKRISASSLSKPHGCNPPGIVLQEQ